MRRSIPAITAILGAIALPAAAFAHAHLKSAVPAANSTVQAAPSEIAIDFTEDLEGKFSRIEVKNQAGERVDQGDSHLATGDAKHLVVSLKPLAPGHYRVLWHATSTDTHKSDGAYAFDVTP